MCPWLEEASSEALEKASLELTSSERCSKL